MPLSVDHLVYASPDLDLGIDAIARQLGIRAAPGGRHPGWGTRNALISLGPRTYLEIIGPDLEGPAPRIFGIDALDEPRLVAWAAAADDLPSRVGTAARNGLVLGAVTRGSRRRDDGTLLQWTLTDPAYVPAGGLVPFLIDWGDTEHPAQRAPGGATLVGLRGEHPAPEIARAQLRALELDRVLPIAQEPRPALVAIVRTRGHDIELR